MEVGKRKGVQGVLGVENSDSLQRQPKLGFSQAVMHLLCTIQNLHQLLKTFPISLSVLGALYILSHSVSLSSQSSSSLSFELTGNGS